MNTTARYEVIGCNDEQTHCDFCGRDHLKKTVILRSTDDDRAIVRVGSTCAVRACAVPGVRTKTQLDRHVSAARAEIERLTFRRDQAAAVLADPARLEANAETARNAPFGPHYGQPWTAADEAARWRTVLAEATAELAARGAN